MNIDSVKSAFLSTSDGKILSVQGAQKPKTHQLVAKNEQKPGYTVKVYHMSFNGARPCMAFGFEVQNKYIFPVVTHGEEIKVQVLPTDEPITERTFDETYLFRWGEKEISGDWKSLESVAKPKKYLCVKNQVNVTITEERNPTFRIGYSDEKKDKEWQFLCGSGKTQENETNPYKISLRRRNLKRGRSCCEGSAAPNKPLCCNYSIRKGAFLSKLNIDSVKSAFLSTSDGKILSVQGAQKPKTHQLVAKNEQKPGYTVKVYHMSFNGARPCMAFGFEVQNKYIFPVVTHGEEIKVQVLPTDEPITERTFDETYLFRWGEKEISGDWKSLESVAKPKKYLCVKNQVNVTITEERNPTFRIGYSDEKKDKEWQFLCGSGKTQENETNPYKISLRRRNLKRGRSCCEGSAAPNKPLCCNYRKAKRMKM